MHDDTEFFHVGTLMRAEIDFHIELSRIDCDVYSIELCKHWLCCKFV